MLFAQFAGIYLKNWLEVKYLSGLTSENPIPHNPPSSGLRFLGLLYDSKVDMSHVRRKICVLCAVKYEYLWEDQESWVEYVTCPNCRYRGEPVTS